MKSEDYCAGDAAYWPFRRLSSSFYGSKTSFPSYSVVKDRPPAVKFLNSIIFLVRVPVLSEKTYST